MITTAATPKPKLKLRGILTCLIAILLITAIGPIDNSKILGAHEEYDGVPTTFPVSPLTSFQSKEDLLRAPASRPTIVQVLKANVKSKEQWMRLAKAVPVLHATQLKDFDVVEVTATGYTAGVESTGKTPDHPQYGITFSGVKVRRDVFSTIAADRKVFPIGTVLHIPGYGYGVVADTGSAIKGKKIDLFYHTTKEVYDEWGKKKVKVRVIYKGKGKLNEKELDRLNRLILEDDRRKLSV